MCVHKDLLPLDEPKARRAAADFWTMCVRVCESRCIDRRLRRRPSRLFLSSSLSRRRSSLSPRRFSRSPLVILEVAVLRRRSSPPPMFSVAARRCCYGSSLPKPTRCGVTTARSTVDAASGLPREGTPAEGFDFWRVDGTRVTPESGPLVVQPAVRGTRTTPAGRSAGAMIIWSVFCPSGEDS